MSAHQCIFSAIPKNACDPHTELASFMLLVPSAAAFFPPVCALPYWILNIIINYYVGVIAMIAIIKFSLVPLRCFHSSPVCFSVRSHGSQGNLFWHFQATSATWRFKECKTFLGTSATAWVCTGWARPRQLRPGCSMAWAGTWCLGTGRWAGHVGAVPVSIPERIQWYLIQCESFGHPGVLWPFQAPAQQCAKPDCTSQWCGPHAELVMADRGSNCPWKTKQSQLCDYSSSDQGLSDSHGRAQQELNLLSLVCSQG